MTRPISVLRENYHYGRLFAASRTARWSILRRLLYLGAAPLIPLVRLRRIVAEIRRLGRQNDLLPGILREHKRVIFNGDNYTEEWQQEAARRGLPNLKGTVDALPVIIRKDSIDLFSKYKVYSERELHSRYNIFAEKYVKEVTIEANMMVHLAKTMILPAVLRYQTQVAAAVTATKAAGVENAAQVEHLRDLTGVLSKFQGAAGSLDEALHHHADGDAFAHAKYMKEAVLPKMAELRTLGDKLETVVADDLWPLPTYREMLFIK